MHKKRQQQIEERLVRITEGLDEVTRDPKKDKKKWYKLMSIFIKEAIDRFPRHIDLRVINAFVQKAKLNNEFKAIFEMMNCELCDPVVYERFVIFRKKIEVE